jgi:hypothetical protein
MPYSIGFFDDEKHFQCRTFGLSVTSPKLLISIGHRIARRGLVAIDRVRRQDHDQLVSLPCDLLD